MTAIPAGLEEAGDRIAELLRVLELMAAGDTRMRLRISDSHDELDAIAHGINVLVGELGWATARIVEAQEERAVSAERANVSKSIFLRNMSHEIRTPITAMLGFADLLASENLAHDDRLELLRRLHDNGLAVLSLLDDLLDLAKLDAHKIVLNPETVSVVELGREVFASVEVSSRTKGVEMRVEAAHNALGVVRTDRYRLRQILVNLVANAVKFTSGGRISIALTAGRHADDEQWTLDVSDSGIGIPPELHEQLADPFEQGTESIGRIYGGHGLGLALSRRLAEQLGGSLVLLRSAPGEGTVFRLTLKPLPAPPKNERDASEARAQAPRSIRGLRILLAEDHRDLHFALRRLLEGGGATVHSAHNGREAVAAALSDAFDVILMALRMPDTDGLEATRQLRSDGCAVPIVALTADPATLHRSAALAAGCDACLSKPFRIDELMASIQLAARQPAS